MGTRETMDEVQEALFDADRILTRFRNKGVKVDELVNDNIGSLEAHYKATGKTRPKDETELKSKRIVAQGLKTLETSTDENGNLFDKENGESRYVPWLNVTHNILGIGGQAVATRSILEKKKITKASEWALFYEPILAWQLALKAVEAGDRQMNELVSANPFYTSIARSQIKTITHTKGKKLLEKRVRNFWERNGLFEGDEAEVALKIELECNRKSKQARVRAHRESRLAGVLMPHSTHMALARETTGNRQYLMSEVVEDAIPWKDYTKFTLEQVIEVAQQTLIAIDALSEIGGVHRDIKPSNLLITLEPVSETKGIWPFRKQELRFVPHVKITDYGVMKYNRIDSDPDTIVTIPENELAVGTVDYMSPELGTKAGRADVRSDIYNLGATIYFMLTGMNQHHNLPTNLQDVFGKLNNVRTGTTKPTAPNVPYKTLTWLATMMQRDRILRYQTAESALEDVGRLLRGRSPKEAKKMIQEARKYNIKNQRDFIDEPFRYAKHPIRYGRLAAAVLIAGGLIAGSYLVKDHLPSIPDVLKSFTTTQ